MADTPHISLIGTRFQNGYQHEFGIHERDRLQHLYIIGKTGTGKSTLLRNLMLQDAHRGVGFALLDPHGDLCDDILNLIPRHRRSDVVYFDPADAEFPVGFNPLNGSGADANPLVASGIVGAFKNVWRSSWGPRLEYILYATVAALAYCANVSLLGVPRMLMEKKYRDWVIRQVNDPLLRAYWTKEFEAYDDHFRLEAISPIQNKVGQLFLSPLLRNVLGQVRSGLDIGYILNNRKILVANLSKGRLGEDKAQLLGAMIVTAFQLEAMRRASVPEHEREHFQLYVDEFHNFATDSFATVLSEARKYRLGLTMSHQYTSQLPDDLRDAVFGNVGSIISFRVGHQDAIELERAFGAEYPAARFTELANYEVLAKMLMDGNEIQFLGRTYPPLGEWSGLGESIIKQTRERFATPRDKVEGRIKRWLER